MSALVMVEKAHNGPTMRFLQQGGRCVNLATTKITKINYINTHWQQIDQTRVSLSSGLQPFDKLPL